MSTSNKSSSGSPRRLVFAQAEEIICQDPGGRGIRQHPEDNLASRCRGSLQHAAVSLADEGDRIGIITGFAISTPSGVRIETDGPLGSLALGHVLHQIGCEVIFVTDPVGSATLQAALHAAGLMVQPAIFPFEAPDSADPRRCSNSPEHSLRSLDYATWFFTKGPGLDLSHLVAVERAGPSHDLASAEDAQALGFAQLCPELHRNHVHNCRGDIVTQHTAKTHLLFDFVAENGLGIGTIGIGDGGNELGMGSIPWSVIHRNIPDGLGARIACRVKADWCVACGVSNWGAYALAAYIAESRGCGDWLGDWVEHREPEVLRTLIAAGAVDGKTRQATLSVDGLPWSYHAGIWQQLQDVFAQGDSWEKDDRAVLSPR